MIPRTLRVRLAASALALLGACASARPATEPASNVSNTVERLFPVPARALEFALPPEQPLDGKTLLDAFSGATGWTVATSSFEGWPEWQTGLTVADARREPRERVYEFVESILAEKGCVLSVANPREPRVLRLHTFDDARVPNALANATNVDEAELHSWRTHPAQLVRVLTTVGSGDARSAVGALESTRIGSRFARITVLGSSRAILVEGPARWVAEQCQLVRALDRSVAHERTASETAPR